MGNNDLDLKISEAKSIYEWVDIIEGEVYSFVYDVLIQLAEVFD